jgi:hypothetical protein
MILLPRLIAHFRHHHHHHPPPATAAAAGPSPGETPPAAGPAERPAVVCGWCGKSADCNMDGFHMVQVAFGAFQERHCFCCDDCYEAFRKMYPSRVHRNCYERSCVDCDLCEKRYDDEAESVRQLAGQALGERRK